MAISTVPILEELIFKTCSEHDGHSVEALGVGPAAVTGAPSGVETLGVTEAVTGAPSGVETLGVTEAVTGAPSAVETLGVTEAVTGAPSGVETLGVPVAVAGGPQWGDPAEGKQV